MGYGVRFMELKKQVCSLELAKRLKELGVKQESAFAWTADMETPDTKWRLWSSGAIEEWVGPWRAAAFTVAELGEMLPPYISIGDDSLGEKVEVRTLTSDHSKGKWDVWYEGVDGNDERCDWYYQTDGNEADARAKMLVYLLEHNLMDRGNITDARADSQGDWAAG